MNAANQSTITRSTRYTILFANFEKLWKAICKFESRYFEFYLTAMLFV